LKHSHYLTYTTARFRSLWHTIGL